MKYLLVSSNEEKNIAVLKCDNNTFDKSVLETALGEHFDEDIKVNSVEELSLHPLTYIAKCSNEELDMFNIELNETWVY